MREKPTMPAICAWCDTPYMAIPRHIRQGRRCCSTPCAYRLRRHETSQKVWSELLRHPEPDGCWDYTGRGVRNGYGFLHQRGEETFMHRRAWVMATGETLTSDDVIAHVCDRRICCRNDDAGTYEVGGILYPRQGHLFKTTIRGNILDRDLKGRHPRGVATGVAKLTDEQVLEIRRLWEGGSITQRELSERYGVHQGRICLIVNRHSWTHI